MTVVVLAGRMFGRMATTSSALLGLQRPFRVVMGLTVAIALCAVGVAMCVIPVGMFVRMVRGSSGAWLCLRQPLSLVVALIATTTASAVAVPVGMLLVLHGKPSVGRER